MRALTTVVPVTEELIVAGQEPPVVVQLLDPTKAPGPERIENVTGVPSAAGTSRPVPPVHLDGGGDTWFVFTGLGRSPA